jgi:hypothetical protein
MTIDRSLNVRSSGGQVTSATLQVARPDLRALTSLALQGLVSMFDPEKQLFCHRLFRGEQGYVREGLSPRYTLMTLLGLREMERAGVRVPFDTDAVYSASARNTDWIQGVGDLGLMMWLTAAFAPDQVQDFFRRFTLEGALERYADARQTRTMELSWFLAGLAHAAVAAPGIVPDLIDLACETYHRLEENQSECGLFVHMSRRKSVAGFLRGGIGSFADQIYPVYACCMFAQAFHVEEPIEMAVDCARAICGAQGESGQWWWLYETETGRVASPYPVYSVHQHGMAPMGLFALEQATGQSFDEPIYKGLRWIYGCNELGKDMRNSSQNLVWRCITPRNKRRKYQDILMSLFPTSTRKSASTTVGPLEILFEERPYEFGWMLFAFGSRLDGRAEYGAGAR